MRALGAVSLMALPIPASADFIDAGFCPSLLAAYAAGKQASSALRGSRIAWGTCQITDDGTLRCTRRFADAEEGRRANAALKAAVAACVTPFGLRQRDRLIEGVESTRFDGADIDPSIAIYHAGPIVNLSIITAD